MLLDLPILRSIASRSCFFSKFFPFFPLLFSLSFLSFSYLVIFSSILCPPFGVLFPYLPKWIPITKIPSPSPLQTLGTLFLEIPNLTLISLGSPLSQHFWENLMPYHIYLNTTIGFWVSLPYAFHQRACFSSLYNLNGAFNYFVPSKLDLKMHQVWQ